MNKKLTLGLLAILILCSTELFAQADATSEVRKTVINNGAGLGAVIAVVTSWSRNKSILWAILHGVLSWFYVIYFAVTRDSNN
jgi:ABC-type Fe3+-siderophore transport system permease subunit